MLLIAEKNLSSCELNLEDFSDGLYLIKIKQDKLLIKTLKVMLKKSDSKVCLLYYSFLEFFITVYCVRKAGSIQRNQVGWGIFESIIPAVIAIQFVKPVQYKLRPKNHQHYEIIDDES
ncbi:MAG: hypothetical protein R2852_07920 [Bacteroidia bacterium]